MAKEHGPRIKDDATYEALRDEGASKEKAARIANARANPKQNPSRKGGKSPPYEEWTKRQLRAARPRARRRGAVGHEQGRADRRPSRSLRAARAGRAVPSTERRQPAFGVNFSAKSGYVECTP